MNHKLKIKALPRAFTICQPEDFSQVRADAEFCFTGRTDNEFSLVCRTEDVPPNTVVRDDGWKAFRVEGILDFALVGILAELSALLAEHQIAIFAISTYRTDYILTRAEQFPRALELLSRAGCQIEPPLDPT